MISEHKPLQQDAPRLDISDTARGALLWVLWHHQGGSSPVGQPIRFALGMGSHERLTEAQIELARAWGEIANMPERGRT